MNIKNYLRPGSAFYRGARRCAWSPSTNRNGKDYRGPISHPISIALPHFCPRTTSTTCGVQPLPSGACSRDGRRTFIVWGAPARWRARVLMCAWCPASQSAPAASLLSGNRFWWPDHITGEERRRDEEAPRSKAGSKGGRALLPVGLAPTGLPGRKSKGQTLQGGSETQAGGREGGRGGEEGRREGAWPARRGRALGGGAAALRSRLWGLGFAALGALGRELERGTELGSQSSHRDERRSRRLGFSLRPAAPVRPPDRWESAAASGVAPPAAACAPEGSNSLGCVRRGGRRPSACAFQPPG